MRDDDRPRFLDALRLPGVADPYPRKREKHMWCWKQVSRVGLLALVIASGSLTLLAGTTHPSYAQSSLADPGNITDPGSGPKPGDPDGPTGDMPTPNAGQQRLVNGSTGLPSTPTNGIVPERRYGVWAQWKLALKLWARSAFLAL
jgi:hypothetical protein